MTTIWDRNPKMLDRLRAMAAEGASATQTAKALGVSRNMVMGKASRAGISFNSRYNEPRRIAHALKSDVQTPRYDGPSPPRRFSWQDEGVGA